MDLDFEFEDTLLEYISFYSTSSHQPEQFIISQYLIEKLQRKHFLSENQYFMFNSEYFTTASIVQTLAQFFGDNSNAEPIEDEYEGSLTKGVLGDTCCCFYDGSPYPPSTRSLHVIVASKFNEIHAIGSDFNWFVSRPKELAVEELTWTTSQKFSDN